MDKNNKNILNKLWQPLHFVSSRYGGGFRGLILAAKEAVMVLVRKGPKQVFIQIVSNVRASTYDESDVVAPSSRAGRILPTVFPCKVEVHQQSVAIVICVHDALDDVKRCLGSVLKYSSRPFRVIVVDDGSGDETRDFLIDFEKTNNSISLLRNDQATGYTLAANKGLRAAGEDYVVLLNSDTVVSVDWLDRMIQCAESSYAIGIVGPLSNTASWQSVPEIEHNGDWAPNPLPSGTSISEMAALIAENSPCLYPRLSFLNGFCLLIKQKLIEDIGCFDEVTFARGFCEENDFCLRARKKHWELAVADDVYVYHAQSKSYSNERRKKLAAESYTDFVVKHGQLMIDEGVRQCRFDKVMLGIRARAKYLVAFQELLIKGKKSWQGKKIAVVLPAAVPGGGANVVIAECLAMIKMGVSVTVVNLSVNRRSFSIGYPSLDIPVSWADTEEQIAELCGAYDALIATACHSVKWLLPLIKEGSQQKFAYYIQDYEPYFYESGSAGYKDAVESYSLIPDLIRLTKTKWNQKELKKEIGLHCHCIGVSVNNNLFRPYPRIQKSWPKRPLRIIAMVRPNSPRRGPEVTMRVFKKVSQMFTDQVEIIIFGTNPKEPDLQKLEIDFAFTNLGVLSREKIVESMTESDIFVDFSTYQAMGLTAMEAMSCGLAVILTDQGGVKDFANHEQNCLLVNTRSDEECFAALKRLVENHEIRSKLQRRAIEDMAQYSSTVCAYRILDCIFSI